MSDSVHKLFHQAVEAVPQGFVITDPRQPDNPMIYCNPGFEQLTGYPEKEVLGRNCRFLQGDETDPEELGRLRRAIDRSEPVSVVLCNCRKDGSTFWNALSVTPIFDQEGNTSHFVGVQTDISHVKEMERQLLEAQKMEVIGTLTSGVAHDFNNLLTVITGSSELALAGLATGDRSVYDLLMQVCDAGAHASALVRQLLVFSQKQPLHAQLLDLNNIIVEQEEVLRHLVGERIHVDFDLTEKSCVVEADATQLNQIIWNLVVNARDAMPDGGKIKIQTRRQSSEHSSGAYTVLMELSDTGCGMTDKVKAKIFEPLFTTKESGKGTGLGLATVQRIIQTSGGQITVESEVGKGTTFRIELPGTEEEPLEADFVAAEPEAVDKAMIVLIEDDPMVRNMMAQTLGMEGHTVLEAGSGEEAQRLWQSMGEAPDLVISDVMMPGMKVNELQRLLKEECPETPILLVSGYLDGKNALDEEVRDEIPFIAKPFTSTELTGAVRDILS